MFLDLSLTTISSAGLLGITVLLILFGRLIPLSTLRDKQEEAERWRQAYEAERKARGIADAQTNELLEVAKTTHSIIAAMASTSERLIQSGDSDAPRET
jgi:hypothetical protein